MCEVLVFSSFMHECTYVCSFRSSVYMFVYVCMYICVCCMHSVVVYSMCLFTCFGYGCEYGCVSLLCTVPDTSYLRFYAELPSRLSAEYRAV